VYFLNTICTHDCFHTYSITYCACAEYPTLYKCRSPAWPQAQHFQPPPLAPFHPLPSPTLPPFFHPLPLLPSDRPLPQIVRIDKPRPLSCPSLFTRSMWIAQLVGQLAYMHHPVQATVPYGSHFLFHVLTSPDLWNHPSHYCQHSQSENAAKPMATSSSQQHFKFEHPIMVPSDLGSLGLSLPFQVSPSHACNFVF